MDIRPISPNMKPSTQPTPGSTPRPPEPAQLRYSSTPSTLPASPLPPASANRPVPPSQPAAPIRPPQPPQPQAQSIYPTPTERPFQSMGPATPGSEADTVETPKLGAFGSIPTGVVVISILTVISGIGVFLIPSTTGTAGIGMFVLFINVLLAFGLFSLNNAARIIFVIFSSLAIASSGMRLFALADLQSKTDKQRTLYNQQIESLRSKQQTNEQAEAIAKLNLEVKKQEGLTSSIFVRAYIIVTLQLVSSTAIVIYLLRPSIKDRFE